MFRILSYLEQLNSPHGKSPGWIDKSRDQDIETSRNRVHDGHLSHSLAGVEQHDTCESGGENISLSAFASELTTDDPPIIVQSMTNAAGPPRRSAPPDPMKRPVPMEPPTAIICKKDARSAKEADGTMSRRKLT